MDAGRLYRVGPVPTDYVADTVGLAVLAPSITLTHVYPKPSPSGPEPLCAAMAMRP